MRRLPDTMLALSTIGRHLFLSSIPWAWSARLEGWGMSLCSEGKCRVKCLDCGCIIHLDDENDFPLCEECASDLVMKKRPPKNLLKYSHLSSKHGENQATD